LVSWVKIFPFSTRGRKEWNFWGLTFSFEDFPGAPNHQFEIVRSLSVINTSSPPEPT
jgi:hypothetical protein